MDKKDKEFIVQQIRTQYTEKEFTKVDELKRLDAKVKKPAKIFAYVFGTIGALILGGGMSLIMTDIANGSKFAFVIGLIIGVAGLIMSIVNYPLYTRKLAKRRNEYADRIIKLSDEIMEG